MEEKTTSVGKVSITYGLILTVISIAFTMVIDIVGLTGNQAVQYFGLVIFIVLTVLAHREFKKKGDGYMSYGQGLGIGTLIALVSSVLGSIFFYFYMTSINKSYISTLLKLQREKLEESGKYGSELEQMMEATEKFMQPVTMVIMALVVGFLFSFIVSLILAAITQKKRPENLA